MTYNVGVGNMDKGSCPDPEGSGLGLKGPFSRHISFSTVDVLKVGPVS